MSTARSRSPRNSRANLRFRIVEREAGRFQIRTRLLGNQIRPGDLNAALNFFKADPGTWFGEAKSLKEAGLGPEWRDKKAAKAALRAFVLFLWAQNARKKPRAVRGK